MAPAAGREVEHMAALPDQRRKSPHPGRWRAFVIG
jgi:hypothetical protein